MNADCPCGANAVQCEDPFYGGWKCADLMKCSF